MRRPPDFADLQRAVMRGHDSAQHSVIRTIANLLDRLEGRIGFDGAAHMVLHEAACQLATEIGCEEAAIHLRELATHFDRPAS